MWLKNYGNLQSRWEKIKFSWTWQAFKFLNICNFGMSNTDQKKKKKNFNLSPSGFNISYSSGTHCVYKIISSLPRLFS